MHVEGITLALVILRWEPGSLASGHCQGQIGMVWATFRAYEVPLGAKGSTLLPARTVGPSEARSQQY